ncbi:type II secretion system protein E [Ferroglobus placidus DSM 10642]|uniref:Type II secretion system protein E n=1 Tax=Ferroglobus placidus (strain DSM 10642 / AEDII12DO) TaxID=589924 RepID=D3RYX1_FERPA|nr:type II/IV secretion system ATPase subunit [Ferroglobus placidus]ADC65684.1 type II secretion system protein E [Ferroglobus placidus DSM 10642]
MIFAGRYYSLLQKYIPESWENLVEVEEGEEEAVLEDYWIFKPFVYVRIVEDERGIRYRIFEPSLTAEEYELLEEIYTNLYDILILRDLRISIEEKAEILEKAFRDVLEIIPYELDDVLIAKYNYYLFRDFLGFGPIDPLLNDPYIEDISCDGYKIPVYVFHRKYGHIPTDVVFAEAELDKYVQFLAQISGKHLSHGNPMIDATLPDGSRIQATYGTEITTRGSSFSIRKFSEKPLIPLDLIRLGTYSAEQMAYFWLCVENKLNVLVIGETAAGKTTTLNAILMFLPPNVKVISIEDTREISLYHENWIAEVTREAVTEDEKEITMYDLLKAALRQRPDYIVVGEVRGIEAQTLFQAMSTGHAAYSTLHAGDIHQAIYRLETEPLNVPRSLIQFLDVVAVQTQWTKQKVRLRRCKKMYEILGIDPNDKNLLINEIFSWDPYSDKFVQVNPLRNLERIAVIRGESPEDTIRELRNRAEFLKYLMKRGVEDYKTFTSMIHSYYKSPEETFEVIYEEGKLHELEA